VRTVEATLGVRIGVTGTSLRISGAHAEQALAGKVISEIYDLLKHGLPDLSERRRVRDSNYSRDRNAELKDIFLDTIYVSANKRVISPKSINQKVYIDSIRNHDIRFRNRSGRHRQDLPCDGDGAGGPDEKPGHADGPVQAGSRKRARNSASCRATSRRSESVPAPALRRAA